MEAEAKRARYERRRQQVVAAAARVFAERGYHGASTKMIAAEVGIQQGSLYHYLASKEEALEQVCLVGTDGYVRGIEAILQADASYPEKLRAAVDNHMRPFVERRDFSVVFLNERQHLPRERRATVTAIRRRYEAGVEALFVQAQQNGELPDGIEPRVAALGLIGLCNSACNWLGRDGMPEAETVIGNYAAILAMGLVQH